MATEPSGSSKDNNNQGAGTIENRADIPIQKGLEPSEITEELPSGQHGTRKNIILETPTRTQEEAREDFLRINMPPTPTPSPSPRRVIFTPCGTPSPGFAKSNESPGPSSSKSRSTIKTLLPKLSFKFRNTNSEIEKAAFLALEGSATVTAKKPFLSRTLSRIKSNGKKTSSLPVTPIAHSNPGSVHGGNMAFAYPTIAVEKGLQLPIHRSRSVPTFTVEGNATPLGGMFRIVRTIRPLDEKIATTTSVASPTNDTVENEDGGEDIPEEEAVCRICMVELGEGANTFKLECSCKGELSLAHQECAVKWFRIKGNRTCDVCKQEVQNLPVTLLRVQTALGSRGQQAEISQYRVLQDAPILVVVNMLAYFCFLEQLLVSNMGSSAVAMSLPFSCILGLLASMTATTMVRRKHVWIYATVQFGLVVLSAHLFYSLAHMQAVLAILLATFAGFGAVMFGASILVEILNWRRRWLAQLNQQNGSQEGIPVPPGQSSPATHQAQINSQHTASNVGDTPVQMS
ncbi:Zinc finger, RING-CH-type [Sesbania bispinosa]|nr:Zinc finger, RING-CH-type [Sesbania bispinosa]